MKMIRRKTLKHRKPTSEVQALGLKTQLAPSLTLKLCIIRAVPDILGINLHINHIVICSFRICLIDNVLFILILV